MAVLSAPNVYVPMLANLSPHKLVNMRGLCPAAGLSLEPQEFMGANNWGLLLERLRRPKAAVAHLLCVPHGTSRQIPVLMSRREGTGLGHLCWSCSPEGCMRLLSLCVYLCDWMGQCECTCAAVRECMLSLSSACTQGEGTAAASHPWG